MNYWKHSLLSKKKFGGEPSDYLPIHKFIDSSKLFFYDIRHRILLHNTYGIEICIEKFGETIINSNNKIVMVRDIAAEHCKEDLFGVVPTLNNWFKYADPEILNTVENIVTENKRLENFILKPLIMSGLRSALIITHSNFGVYLTREILGMADAIELSGLLKEKNINEMLPLVKLREKWQYSPDLKQLKQIENE